MRLGELKEMSSEGEIGWLYPLICFQVDQSRFAGALASISPSSFKDDAIMVVMTIGVTTGDAKSRGRA